MQDLPKLAFSRTYDTSIRDLYRIIFSDDCPFWKQTLVNKGTTGMLCTATVHGILHAKCILCPGITFGAWKKDETTPGQQIRELSYTLRLDNSIGPKTSFVKETQVCVPYVTGLPKVKMLTFLDNFAQIRRANYILI